MITKMLIALGVVVLGALLAWLIIWLVESGKLP